MTERSTLATQCVLFDLDGTLVDTAPDLVNALNAVLQAEGRETVSFESARAAASHGSVALLQHGFGAMSEDELRSRQRLFIDHYSSNICMESELFVGMDLVLERLEAAHIKWGIVTNKPSLLTIPLLEELRLRERALAVVSGDTLPVAKPNPEPLLYAADQCEVAPEHCIYVGDAQRDIEAALRAKMQPIIAGYGYIGEDDEPETWSALGTIEQPLDLLPWVIAQ